MLEINKQKSELICLEKGEANSHEKKTFKGSDLTFLKNISIKRFINNFMTYLIGLFSFLKDGLIKRIECNLGQSIVQPGIP